MSRTFSLYLDLVRFIAAFLVLLYHSNNRDIVHAVMPFSMHGHAAVIVFFVLSGYVIAYITDTRESTPESYWASRLARIYSLAIPTVLLTPVLDAIGQSLNSSFYATHATHELGWVRIASSLAFMNETWFVSIQSFSNVPYWSLCFEMWYYAFFAVFTFMSGRKRTLVLAAMALIVGPKILLLLPLWVLGVVLYRWKALETIGEATAWLAFLSSFVLYGLFHYFNVTELASAWLRAQIGPELHHQLTFAKFFVGDYLLGPIVFLNFIGCRRICHRFAWLLNPFARPIRAIAVYTFAIYILHQPLVLLFAALFNGNPDGYAFYAEVMIATLASLWLLGIVTEHARPLARVWLCKRLASPAVRKLMARLFDRPLQVKPA
jgi:peptidoglycan/LPS O-acetylase OafA/YrhL